MKYFHNNEAQLTSLTGAMCDLLTAQVKRMNKLTNDALKQYAANGEGESELIQSFFLMSQAAIKVLSAQQALTGEKPPKELIQVLSEIYGTFKALDAEVRKLENQGATQEAMKERQGATIH